MRVTSDYPFSIPFLYFCHFSKKVKKKSTEIICETKKGKKDCWDKVYGKKVNLFQDIIVRREWYIRWKLIAKPIKQGKAIIEAVPATYALHNECFRGEAYVCNCTGPKVCLLSFKSKIRVEQITIVEDYSYYQQ